MPQEAKGRRPGYESANFIAPVSPSAVPLTEKTLLGPVAYGSDLVGYIPWAPVSHAPGVGVANLVYLPNYLMSAPNNYAGNGLRYRDGAFGPTAHATMISGLPQTLDGIGGIQAGQIISGPLYGVEQENDMGLGYYRNG